METTCQVGRGNRRSVEARGDVVVAPALVTRRVVGSHAAGRRGPSPGTQGGGRAENVSYRVGGGETGLLLGVTCRGVASRFMQVRRFHLVLVDRLGWTSCRQGRNGTSNAVVAAVDSHV